jgi:hypothetical protein
VATAEEPTPHRGPAAFERRQDLRAERRRLVSELARKRRCGHREANQWINGRVGVTKVEEATIAELQRSCELLVAELLRASGSRR